MPNNETSELPRGLALLMTSVEYAKALMKERSGGPSPNALARGLSFEMRVELEKLVDTIIIAWSEQVPLAYSLEDIVVELRRNTAQPKFEQLRRRFKGPFPPKSDGSGTSQLVDVPMVFIDRSSKAVAWYLPGVFTARRCALVNAAVQDLSDHPTSALRINGASRNWREDRTTYADPLSSHLRPGQVNMCIAWYEQGHNHRTRLPRPSASFNSNLDNGAMEFLAAMEETNALLGTLLAIVHPDLFEMQISVLQQLCAGQAGVSARPRVLEIFEHWATPFTGFALISNRETPFHRDINGGKMLFDALAVFRNHRDGRLDVPILSARFVYNPGTAFMLPGCLFEHGAGSTIGDRICLASFFRPSVGYGALGSYKEVLPPTEDYLCTKYDWDTWV